MGQTITRPVFSHEPSLRRFMSQELQICRAMRPFAEPFPSGGDPAITIESPPLSRRPEFLIKVKPVFLEKQVDFDLHDITSLQTKPN